MNRYISTVQYDAILDEYFIEIDPALIKEVGWDVDDTIKWIDNEDGTFTLRKSDE
jgi:hypothetical protein